MKCQPIQVEDGTYECLVCGFGHGEGFAMPFRRSRDCAGEMQARPPRLGAINLQGSTEQKKERRRKRDEAVAEAAEQLGVQPAEIKHYARAVLRWRRAGYPARSPERIAEIFSTFCSPPGEPCQYFNAKTPVAGPVAGVLLDISRAFTKMTSGQPTGQCTKCGCCVSTSPKPMLNKLAMATEGCPVDNFQAEVLTSHSSRTDEK